MIFHSIVYSSFSLCFTVVTSFSNNVFNLSTFLIINTVSLEFTDYAHEVEMY